MSGKQIHADGDTKETSKSGQEDLLKQIEELRLANAAKDAELVEKNAELVKKDAQIADNNTKIEDLKATIKTKGYVQYLSQRCAIQHLQSRFASLRC
jgi:uncharacterized protein involved in exopolysaccharide biosynthesis